MAEHRFFNRDLSWLSFNARVMEEAANPDVPVLDRVQFLGIFSSNLDEFYRVRMPVLQALEKIGQRPKNNIDAGKQADILKQARAAINNQQVRYGEILSRQLIPALRDKGIHLLYNEVLPEFVRQQVSSYFMSQVLAFLRPVALNNCKDFFPENNKLYLIVDCTTNSGNEELTLINIPSDDLPRFYTIDLDDKTYILFLDDIIRDNLDKVFKDCIVNGSYSFKVTRTAELDLKDEYPGDLSEQIEKQLAKRDYGMATRFLYQTGTPLRILQLVIRKFDLLNATTIAGGRYHNLKDLAGFPVNRADLSFSKWPAINDPAITVSTIFDSIKNSDRIVHTPYQSYDTVLRFFNEAAINPDVREIYVTLYRVASSSTIANALISAAKNGKRVNVVIELKARFDEANNVKWAKKMRAAGVNIIYSVTALKVHAKIALVKTMEGSRMVYSGLLATGNFNESTARFYTDHILFTTNAAILREMELLFLFLQKREKPAAWNQVSFNHLLVAQFNLQSRFIELIDREITNAKNGLPAQITLKMNNLEEQVLISKLYDASQAGVKVSLVIRSICCLIPGVKGMSENISIRRVIDRYLEHGRVFIFHNSGDPEVFLGSADWMNRNIYHRIEVCFPVHDNVIKDALIQYVQLHLQDNVQAVMLDEHLQNKPVKAAEPPVQAQQEIYRMLSAQ